MVIGVVAVVLVIGAMIYFMIKPEEPTTTASTQK